MGYGNSKPIRQTGITVTAYSISTQVLVVLSMLLAACDDRPAQWDAFITYHEDPEHTEVIVGFKTLELCRAAALQRLEAAKATETGYFECGYKCEFKPEYKMNICKATRD